MQLKFAKLKAFVISFFVTITIVLAIAFVMFEFSFSSFATTKRITNSPIVYEPTPEDDLTSLCIGLNELTNKPNSILLVKMSPIKRKIIICSIPSNTESTQGVNTTTMEKFYDIDGAYSVVNAVSELLSVKIDRYVVLKKDAISNIVDSLGGFEFNVPTIFDDTKSEVYLKSGLQTIDGARFCLLAAYNKNGVDEQIALQNQLIVSFLEQKLNSQLKLKLPNLFNSTINQVKTNISRYDFVKRTEALSFLLENREIKNYTIQGEYNKIDDIFIPEQDSILKAKIMFED